MRISGPNLRGSGIEHDLRRKHPYLDYEQYDFDVVIGSAGDCYDRYLVRIEEMRQSVRILRQVIDKLPGGPINVADWKNMAPPKSHVMTKMEELIHHFIVVTEGLDAPPGEVYFAAENPKGELGFYINSRGGGVPYRLKIRAPSFVNLSILPELLPGCMVSDVPSRAGESGLRHGRVRQMNMLRSIFSIFAHHSCSRSAFRALRANASRKPMWTRSNEGMSKKQVESILGHPTSVDQ